MVGADQSPCTLLAHSSTALSPAIATSIPPPAQPTTSLPWSS